LIGTYINYYFHCPRHLWLFAHNINMEQTSEDVYIGKIISENTYIRESHEIHIGNRDHDLSLDFFDKRRRVIHEVKKSNKMEELHIWQAKYYLYVLELLGIEVKYAEIDYPKLKRIIKVYLDNNDRIEIDKTIENIEQILKFIQPPTIINKPYCRKCSYYEFCYC